MVRKPFLLFIDSDVQLRPTCISNFVRSMQKTNGREALTGLILTHTRWNRFLQLFQNIEYLESQVIHRTTEDYLGAVTCLPGALTMIRFESLNSVSRGYFAQRQPRNAMEFARSHLGEDRYLTHLLMEARPERHRIGFCAEAVCFTHACDSLSSLFKQRRRWLLGTLTNEVHMICSPVLWKTMPALMFLQSLSSLRNGPLFVHAAISEAPLGRAPFVTTIGTLLLAYVPIWLLVCLYGSSLRQKSTYFMYPVLLLINPIFGALYSLHALVTFRRRTWGGPRTNAETKRSTNKPSHPVQGTLAPSRSLDHQQAAQRERSNVASYITPQQMQSLSRTVEQRKALQASESSSLRQGQSGPIKLPSNADNQMSGPVRPQHRRGTSDTQKTRTPAAIRLSRVEQLRRFSNES